MNKENRDELIALKQSVISDLHNIDVDSYKLDRADERLNVYICFLNFKFTLGVGGRIPTTNKFSIGRAGEREHKGDEWNAESNHFLLLFL